MLSSGRELRFHCFEGSHNSLLLVFFFEPHSERVFFPHLAASDCHFRTAEHTSAPNWGPKWEPFLRESFLLGALVPTAAGSSLIFMVWRAKRSPKCTLLTFCVACLGSQKTAPKPQSHMLRPLRIYLNLLWECMRRTLHTNVSFSIIL